MNANYRGTGDSRLFPPLVCALTAQAEHRYFNLWLHVRRYSLNDAKGEFLRITFPQQQGLPFSMHEFLRLCER